MLLLTAMLLRLACVSTYAIATYRRTASPNLVSWSFWMLTPLIAGIAQHVDGRSAAGWLSVSYAVGPAVVLAVGLVRSRATVQLTRTDIVCAVCAGSGLLLWRLTDSPVWALVFSIVTDVAAALPTIVKTYRRPWSEPVAAYAISVLASATGLVGLGDWRPASIAFALCVLCLDLAVLTIALARRPVVSVRERKSQRPMDPNPTGLAYDRQ